MRTNFTFDEDDAIPIRKKRKKPENTSLSASKENTSPRRTEITSQKSNRTPASGSRNNIRTVRSTEQTSSSVEKQKKQSNENIRRSASSDPSSSFVSSSRYRSGKNTGRNPNAAPVNHASKSISEIPSSSRTQNSSHSVSGNPVYRSDRTSRSSKAFNYPDSDTAKRSSDTPKKSPVTSRAVKTAYSSSYSYNKPRKAKSYKIPYLVFVGILCVISVIVLLYVRGALVEYEASQPENILSEEIDKLREADNSGKFEEILSLDNVRNEFSATDDEIEAFKDDFLSSEITFKESHDTVDASQKTFDVLSDGCKVASFTLDHISQKTKLLIFTLDKWKVSSFEACGYEVKFKAPASVIVKNSGVTVSGEKDDATSKVSYDIKSLSKPDITINDVLGNSVKYDQNALPTFTDYKITIPSNFKIIGKETVPLSAATLKPIDSLKYVKEYCESVPDTATYIVSLMSDTPDFRILDNNGDEVAFELNERKVTIDNQVGRDTLSLDADIDPIEVAKLWSFFMTQDLTGKANGYYQISPYLITDSYLQGVAWKWATGIDITFTSTHSLENPPFCTEKIDNFVVYSDDCFSCDILLEKNMHLSTGMLVKDTIHSTFYFVNYDDTDNGIDDPHWVFVDYKEIQ